MGDPPDDSGPWTAVRFPNQEARDQFLLAVASNVNDAWGAEPAPDDGLGAWIRWRPRQFFGLNAIAYAYDGRIILTTEPRWD